MVNESQGDGRPVRPVGLYRHPNGAEEIASSPVQGDAFVRLGFEYVGSVEHRTVTPTAEAQPQGFVERILHPQPEAPAEAPAEAPQE